MAKKTAVEPISGLSYKQGVGFSPVDDVEALLGVPVGSLVGTDEEIHARLSAAGFGEHTRLGVECVDEIHLFARGRDAALVTVCDGSTYQYIIAMCPEDLMALRIALAPLVQEVVSTARLEALSMAVEHMFIHAYRHEPNKPCTACETYGERIDRQARERRARERARHAAVK